MSWDMAVAIKEKHKRVTCVGRVLMPAQTDRKRQEWPAVGSREDFLPWNDSLSLFKGNKKGSREPQLPAHTQRHSFLL